VSNVPREDLLPRPTGGRFVIGARQITEAEWLPPDPELLRMRQMSHSAHRGEIFAFMDGWGGVVSEVFDALPHDAPDDICILGRVNDRWVLVGGELCFPNRWVLREKIGLPVLDVHGPVPGYATQVGAGVDSLLDRLVDGRILERSNWGISDTGEYFEPHTPPPQPDIDPADLVLRVERQTLRHMEPGVIVFTIRTYMERIGDFVRRGSEATTRLAEAIEELPADVLEYKAMTPYRDQLLWFLREPSST
jgi:hypothetical protein